MSRVSPACLHAGDFLLGHVSLEGLTVETLAKRKFSRRRVYFPEVEQENNHR
jgi:hypothetical protein